MKFTVEERRVLLDLIDEEHSRDQRTHSKGRTSKRTFKSQTKLYETLRFKLVAMEIEESPDENPSPG